ncbi:MULTISPECIES: rhodanese-like domain-containing protein [Bacillaceae]|uniref:Rhodanese-like domain-containing protein n=1 Tax=Evansella alkalicola TaxID=745819 RepID=A0ABS6JX91_9BACI|nr:MULTISPECIES: rhodanese-like domain-containing protein [Bacillaceae]MBU9721842.1 rhodanese-like domain-containing protein [Bacillus alkalicola]
MSFEQDGIKQIDVNELKELIKDLPSDKVVLDVREPEEYESGHIPGIPLLPMRSIPSMLNGFNEDKEYIFICRSGNRSQNVSLFLKENGFENVVNFNGGMLSWDGEEKEGPEFYIESDQELRDWKK